MPTTAALTPAASILTTERIVATLANGDTVGVLASGLPVSTAQAAADTAATNSAVATAAADATAKVLVETNRAIAAEGAESAAREAEIEAPISSPNSEGQGEDILVNRRGLRALTLEKLDALGSLINKKPGAVWLSGSGQYVECTTASAFAPGNYSATFILWVQPIGDGWYFTTRATTATSNGVGIQLRPSLQDILVRVSDGTNFAGNVVTPFNFPEGPVMLALVIDRYTDFASIYVGDTLVEKVSIEQLGSIGQATSFWIGKYTTADTEMGLYGFAYLDVALTAAEVRMVGRSPSYLSRAQWSGVASTVLTSGTVTARRAYRVNTYVSGDDFTNIGGVNATGAVFIATGTTPTTWTNGSSLQRVGLRTLLNVGASSYLTLLDTVEGQPFTLNGSPVIEWETPRLVQKNQISTNTTMTVLDHGKKIVCTAALTVTLPSTLPRFWQADFVLTASATLTFSATTFRAPAGATSINTQYKTVRVWHDGSGIFYGEGF